MARDSSIKFLSDSESRISEEKMWWNSRLHPSSGSLDVGSFCSFNDDSIVSVSGVLFQIMTDVKRVRNEDKELLTLRIADHSGHVDIRSWNLSRADFHSFIDKPILFQRVRVTSFAGIKEYLLLQAVRVPITVVIVTVTNAVKSVNACTTGQQYLTLELFWRISLTVKTYGKLFVVVYQATRCVAWPMLNCSAWLRGVLQHSYCLLASITMPQ